MTVSVQEGVSLRASSVEPAPQCLKASASCMKCHRLFHAFRRRHHCRALRRDGLLKEALGVFRRGGVSKWEVHRKLMVIVRFGGVQSSPDNTI